MLLEIVKRTPTWVFLLFALLLALGWSQSRTRTVPRSRISLLPLAMLMLSLFGVLSLFGRAPLAALCWASGILFALLSGLKRTSPRGASYSTASGSFTIPGSWVPLYLMMAIFFVRYGVGVVVARRLPVASTTEFIGLISYTCGFLSGVFWVRALAVLRLTKNPGMTSPICEKGKNVADLDQARGEAAKK